MKVISRPYGQPQDYLPVETMATERAVLRANVRKPMLAGLAVVTLLIAGFGGWAASAPLAGGAVAPGVISPDGNRKTVQHLEGGIIGEIMVRDGDDVAAGQPLLTLEDTQARAGYEMLLHQYRALKMVQARLTAEQLGRDDVDIPPELLAAGDDPDVRDVLAVQRQLFVTRREALTARRRVLQQRVLQIRDQIDGFAAQLTSADHQLVIITEELEAKEFLLRKELLQKSQVLAVRRLREQIGGDRGEYRAAIARGRQQIGEAELELVSLEATRADEIATELDKVRGDLAKIKEQLGASADTLKRTEIYAPVAGTIVNSHFKTRGGVIGPGQSILDIVPANDDLLIDARVAPIDIDVVHAGLAAQVHLSAFSRRSLPEIEGKVRSVSADSLRDEQTGMTYYLARVEVDRAQLSGLGVDVRLVPGMPAEVLIVTSERTLFGYLLQPFRDVFRRSLREV